VDDDFDAPAGEIRCIAAGVRYDGQIDAELLVPGYDEPQRMTFPGSAGTLLLNWSQVPEPVDLQGTSAADRRRQEIVARHVARLNRDLEQRRWTLERQRREHLAREADHVG
jgi:hypothetical protein